MLLQECGPPHRCLPSGQTAQLVFPSRSQPPDAPLLRIDKPAISTMHSCPLLTQLGTAYCRAHALCCGRSQPSFVQINCRSILQILVALTSQAPSQHGPSSYHAACLRQSRWPLKPSCMCWIEFWRSRRALWTFEKEEKRIG